MRERATNIRPAQLEDPANQLRQWPHAPDHVRRPVFDLAGVRSGIASGFRRAGFGSNARAVSR
jgi:hypothetical protein